MNKLSILIAILALVSVVWHNAPETNKDVIEVYVSDDILYIYPKANRIETEGGEVFKFDSRTELSNYISDRTANLVNSIELTPIMQAEEYVDMVGQSYELLTDSELQELINNACMLYQLGCEEQKELEARFYL